MNSKLKVFVYAALVTPLAVASVAMAQTPDSANTASDSSSGDIIVTAQKRAERLMDVGLTITAASAEQLQERGVGKVEDLVKLEPSLQFAQSLTGEPVYTLRGVGFFQTGFAAPPTVSLYQDEVAYPFTMMAAGSLLDVERVEVLKGPQGLLYGQNATGGLVNFIAAKPTKSLEAGVNATYARFGAAHFDAYIGGPVTDTLGMRLAVQTDQGGAWQKSNTRDDELGDRNFWSGRLITQWKPSDDLSVSLTLSGFRDKSETQAGQLLGYVITSPFVFGLANRVPTAAQIAADPQIFPDQFLAMLQEPISPKTPRAADWVAGTRPHKDQKHGSGSLRIDWGKSDAFNITSITNYQSFRMHDTIDVGGASVLAASFIQKGSTESFNQELRFHGEAVDGRLKWLVGANYEDIRAKQSTDVFTPVSIGFLVPLLFTDNATGLPLPPINRVSGVANPRIKNKSVFASGSFDITPELSLNGGIRYTENKVNVVGYVTGDASLVALATGGAVTIPDYIVTIRQDGTVGPARVQRKFKNYPWRVGLDFKAAPNTLLYALVSQGYKGASPQCCNATVYTQATPADQESLLAYEVGIKTELLDRRLTITSAAFYYDYTDKQLQGRLADPIFGSIITTVNVPKSRVFGGELAVAWRDDGLTLDASAAYLNSKVTETFLNINPYGDAIDFKGETFPYTPKFAGSAGFRYEEPIRDGLNYYGAGRVSYQSKTVSGFGNGLAVASGFPSFANKAYALLDLSVGLEGESWRAELWGRNVTNTYYWNTSNVAQDQITRFAGQGATYGVTVGYKFR